MGKLIENVTEYRHTLCTTQREGRGEERFFFFSFFCLLLFSSFFFSWCYNSL
jgi:hypothetical protein